MNKRVIITALLMSFLCGINSSFAVFNSDNSAKKQIIENETNLKGYSLFVPANTICNAILATEINSNNAIIGQTIKAVLLKDFTYENTTIASKWSIINGSIVVNKTATKDSPAQIQVKFTTIKTPYNNIIPINASICTQDSNKILEGKVEDGNSAIIQSNSEINIIFEQPITLGVQ